MPEATDASGELAIIDALRHELPEPKLHNYEGWWPERNGWYWGSVPLATSGRSADCECGGHRRIAFHTSRGHTLLLHTGPGDDLSQARELMIHGDALPGYLAALGGAGYPRENAVRVFWAILEREAHEAPRDRVARLGRELVADCLPLHGLGPDTERAMRLYAFGDGLVGLAVQRAEEMALALARARNTMEKLAVARVILEVAEGATS